LQDRAVQASQSRLEFWEVIVDMGVQRDMTSVLGIRELLPFQYPKPVPVRLLMTVPLTLAVPIKQTVPVPEPAAQISKPTPDFGSAALRKVSGELRPAPRFSVHLCIVDQADKTGGAVAKPRWRSDSNACLSETMREETK
jgi:hypothetical protein